VFAMCLRVQLGHMLRLPQEKATDRAAVHRARKRICPRSMARWDPGDLLGSFGKNSGSRANERVNRGDEGGAAGAAGRGPHSSRIPLGRRGRVVALKTNGPVDSRAGFLPVRPTRRNPVYSVRPWPPGSSQKPLDERNQATTTLLAPRRSPGATAPNFGDRVCVLRRLPRAFRVRARTLIGPKRALSPQVFADLRRVLSRDRDAGCRFCEALRMDRSMNGGAVATEVRDVRESSEARERARSAH